MRISVLLLYTCASKLLTYLFNCSKNQITRAPVFLWQILPNSAAQFVKFCEILQHFYPQIPYIPWPVPVVVLTDNISKFKEFIVTFNVKTHYIRPLMTKKITITIIKKHSAPSTQITLCQTLTKGQEHRLSHSLQRLEFIAFR